MISFYPGPSKVHEEVPYFVRKAYKKGVLSINHRSPEFQELYRKTASILKNRLNIPGDYKVAFTSSATECWEIVAQSLIQKKSYHIFNGAFGKKWFDYTRRLNPGADDHPFDCEHEIDTVTIGKVSKAEVICLTQNETSNGTQIPYRALKEIRSAFPDPIIAIDATSSMAGIRLPFLAGDVWFASVQKCFGLPSGMALFIWSPRAQQRALQIDENNHYNSLNFIQSNLEKWQTTHTPNIMEIYLLYCLLKRSGRIKTVDHQIHRRYKEWISFFEGFKSMEVMIKNEKVRSFTVIPIKAEPAQIRNIREKSRAAGFILGNGYGDLKETTLRIANFPALKANEIRKLQGFLRANFE